MSDKTILRQLIGKIDFSNQEYDRVLWTVSQLGYNFAYEIEGED